MAMTAHPPRPIRLPFPLQDGEQVIQVFRRHWWFLWPRTVLWVVFALAPVVAAAWLFSELDILDNLGIFFGAVVAIWLAYWAVRLFLNWYRYHNDIWVITNQRLVDSLKPTPFRLHISTADLVNLQDMTIEKDGIIPSLLNFGDVVCETAGKQQQFRLGGVPNPAAVQLLVDKERDRERMRYS